MKNQVSNNGNKSGRKNIERVKKTRANLKHTNKGGK
jgi:hypothetical protein